MELADRVRIRREELNMSQDELARRMGYKSRTSINKIEAGRPISQKIVMRLAEALETSPSYLMGWIDEETAAKNEIRADVALLMLRDDDYTMALKRTLKDEKFRNLLIKLAKTEDEKLQGIYQISDTLL